MNLSISFLRNDASGLVLASSERREALTLTSDGRASVRALSGDELQQLSSSSSSSSTPLPQSIAASDDEAQVHALLGVLELFSERFAWLALDVAAEGELRRGERVFRVVRSVLVRVGTLAPAALTDAELAAQRATLEQLSDFLNDDLRLYCSPDFDVTRRTVDRLRAPGAPRDPRFCWNDAWSRSVRAAAPLWVVDVVDGFFQSELVVSARLVLWARRSALAQGARYFARGATLGGDVANMVETEQLLVVGERATVFSVVRGSIPIWWHQQGGELFKPPPVPFVAASTQAVLRRHYERLIATHGAPVVTVSLIDLTGNEGVLATHFREAMQLAALADPRLVFHEYDFHERTKGGKYENVSELLGLLLPHIAASGLTVIDDAGRVVEAQRGVVRVNCIDCLDRTNVVQSMIAMRALDAQAAKLGVVGVVGDSSDAFRRVWSEQADALSQAYTSASALKTDFTRTGKRSLAGRIGDSLTSVKRLMNRAFTDTEKQSMLDLFLARHSLVGLSSLRQRFSQLSLSWKARSDRNTELWLAVDSAANALLVADVAAHELHAIPLADAAERAWPDINRPNLLWLAVNQFCPPRTSCAALRSENSDAAASSTSSTSSGGSGAGEAGASTDSGRATSVADSSKTTNFLRERAMAVAVDSVSTRQALLRAIGASSSAARQVTMIAASVDLDHCDTGAIAATNSSWLSNVVGADTDLVSVALFASERAVATANALRLPIQAQLGAEWHLCARHSDEPNGTAVLLFVRATSAALISNIELSQIRTVRAAAPASSQPGSRKLGGIRDKLKQATDKIKDTTRQLSGTGRSEGSRAVIGAAVTFALGDWLRVGVLASRDDRNRDVDGSLSNGTMLESIDTCVYLTSSQSHLPDNVARRDSWQSADSARRISFLGRVDGSVAATTKSLACDVVANRTDNSLCARARFAPIAYDGAAPAKDLSLSLMNAALSFEPTAPSAAASSSSSSSSQSQLSDLTVLVFARCLAVGVAVRPTQGAGDTWALPAAIELEIATPLAVAARSRIHVELWSRRTLIGTGCIALSNVLSANERQTRAKPVTVELCSKALKRQCTMQLTLDARWPEASQLLQRRQSQAFETFVPGAPNMRSSLGPGDKLRSITSDDDLRALSGSPPPAATAAAPAPSPSPSPTPTASAPLISFMDL